jgi:hypothetical protein
VEIGHRQVVFVVVVVVVIVIIIIIIIIIITTTTTTTTTTTALREPWPPVLFASTGLSPELSFSILQSSSLVGPLERHLAI